jgi:hypothetical protein
VIVASTDFLIVEFARNRRPAFQLHTVGGANIELQFAAG